MFFNAVLGVIREMKNFFLSSKDNWHRILMMPKMQYRNTNPIPTRNGITKGLKPDGIRSIIDSAD